MARSTSELDLFEGRAHGPWRAIYGAIVACLGAAALWSHLDGGGPESLAVALSLLAGGFILGGILVFAPSGARLDFASGTYRAWHGPSLPWLGRRGRLAEIRRVDVGVRRVSSRNSANVVHVLSARLEGERPLEIAWLDSYEAVRHAGETLARRLDVPLCDATSGEEVVRAPADLDRPLHRRSDRRRRHGGLQVAAPPAGSRLTHAVHRETQTLRVHLDAPGFRLHHLAPLLVGAGVAVLTTILPFRRRHGVAPSGPRWLFLCLLAAALVVLLLRVIASATRETGIEAGPGGLHVRWRSWLSTRERRLSRDLIEEVLVGSAPSGRAWYAADFFADAVLARSDRETIAVGSHLGAAEKSWLRDAIEKAIAAG